MLPIRIHHGRGGRPGHTDDSGRSGWTCPALRQPALTLLLACCVLSGPARADCDPVPGGPPDSCTASPASIGGDGPGAGAGNPLNVITGNKYQREDDMPALPGVLGLELVRHYNSAYSRPGAPNGPLGREWKLSYETELVDRFGKLQILQADGSRVIFQRDPHHPGLCRTTLPANGRLALHPQANGQPDYTWTWPSGRRLHFNAAGKLDSITAPSGETLTLQYDTAQVLVKVTDPQGRSLHLSYFGRDARAGERYLGVQAIDTPVGRYTYEYGSALPPGSVPLDPRQLLSSLVRVRLPTRYEPERQAHPLTSRGNTTSTVSRLYHHDDPRLPWLLTGISIETTDAQGRIAASRYATFGYDSQGRANISTHADGVGKVTLDYSAVGTTVLTNSVGRQTTYRHAVIGGQHRLLEVRGAGCATCGESNVRYGYTPSGQWRETIRLDAQGVPVSAARRELDAQGRPVRIGRVAYQGGHPGPLQWRLRLAYQGDSAAPVLIARPSVVPGLERQTRIAYNSAGQPLRITQTGWIPTADGRHAAAPLARTTSYGYTVIHGRSLLARIDGPLPNGPADSPQDSDVTLFEYDHQSQGGVPAAMPAAAQAALPANSAHSAQAAALAEAPSGQLARYDEKTRRDGVLTRVVAPGNVITEVLARDAALRPTRLRVSDDGRIQFISAGYQRRGAPEDLTWTGGGLRRAVHYDYAADGQLQAVTHPGNQRSSVGYDAAGRAERIILPDGSGLALDHDTEDHTTRLARHRDMRADADPLSLTVYRYDHATGQPSRLASSADALGALHTYGYNDAGQVIALVNALGARTALDYDSDGRLASRTTAAGTGDSATLRLSWDSTGHATGITAPNGGHTVRRHDDFGQLVFEADPDRGITLLRHDAGGRLLAHIDETGATTRYTYDHAGRLLSMGKDARPNLLQFQYQGRLQIRMTATADGNPDHATERLDYQYDALGQLTQETRWQAALPAEGAGGAGGAGGSAASATGSGAGTGTGAAAPWLRFITRYEYDEAGRMVRQWLPDGHSVRYRYRPAAPAGQPHAPSGQLDAILFDEQVVVSDIAHTIAGGVTAYTFGNGARQLIQQDQRGRIEQLRVEPGPQTGWWRRLAAWLTLKGRQPATLYAQVNQYDAANRLTALDRQLAATGEGDSAPRHERYTYDHQDRLSGIDTGDDGNTVFRYDPAGNRLAQAGPSGERRYHYAQGGNQLLATSGAAAALPHSAWLYHPTGLPLAQWQRTADSGASARRILYNSDQRPIVVEDNGRIIARYRYNSQGERIAKTVYPAPSPLRPAAPSHSTTPAVTRHYLYQHQRLAAEADSSGQITAHYIYLFGKPVAKVEMEDNTSLLHRVWQSATRRIDADDRVAHIYAIITDHLGTPQQVLDAQQRPVWQAVTSPFGQARVIHAVRHPDGAPFEMHLRLPGQTADAETGLHYNYRRDYDPATGRYTTPDPLREAGQNPYAYVDSNPLTWIDPLGLFQSDIHYYMTFFLGVAAGMHPDEARVVALAAQYVDDNPDTRPLNLDTGISDAHRARLLTYHFTMVPSSIDTATGLVNGDIGSYGAPPDSPAYANIPENAQLGRLYAAMTTAGNASNLINARCTQLQFLGEYLHAFEDTFAHRDQQDRPFALLAGGGHGGFGSHPDYTYNHTIKTSPPGERPPLPAIYWSTNEDRTLQAEKEVFAKLAAWGDPSKAKSFEKIEATLREFNKIPQHEGSGETTEEKQNGYLDKINLLQLALNTLGYTTIKITGTGAHSFKTDDASDNRAAHLHDKNKSALDQKLYQGAILPR